ncbi:MAG: hypothetical protein GXY33_00525 [Phycisphaerae bacterium]|nr:hypothetical protein [Phycisphaerae bacterium]
MPIKTVAATLLTLLFSFSALRAEQATVGRMTVATGGGGVTATFDGVEIFTVAPLQIPGDQPTSLEWALVEQQDALETRTLLLRADDVASLTVSIDGRNARIVWESQAATAARPVVRVKDEIYRTGEGFNYAIASPSGRTAAGTVAFDPLNPEKTKSDFAALTIQGPKSPVRFAPAETVWEFVDVRKEHPTAGQYEFAAAIAEPQTWRREFTVTVENAGEFHPIDLRAAVNMGLRDDVADDRTGGWTDQGGNDLREFPVGPQYFLNVPFDVIDPAENDDRAVIMLRGEHRMYFAREASVAVGRKFATAYVLHASAWTPDAGATVAHYKFHYDDGTQADYPVLAGRDVFEWWGTAQIEKDHLIPDGEPRAAVAWVGKNQSGIGGVRTFVMTWSNPNPDKTVESITFESAGDGVPGILALTVSNGDYQATGAPVTPPRAELPLTPIMVVREYGKIGHLLTDTISGPTGVPIQTQYMLHTVKPDTPLALIDQPIPAHIANQLADYVKNGGNVFLAYEPPYEHLDELLPFEAATASLVASPPGEFLALVPADRRHPAFSGLPWQNDLEHYPVSPVSHRVTFGSLKEGAQVIATWTGGDPALVLYPLGKGRVLYLAAPSISLEPSPTNPINGFTGYFYAKLYYWLTGHDQDAIKLGRMAQARIARNTIAEPYAAAKALIEDVQARGQLLGNVEICNALRGAYESLLAADDRIDRLDDRLLTLDFSTDLAADYGQVRLDIEKLFVDVAALNEELTLALRDRSDVLPYQPQVGRKLPIGYMLGGDSRSGPYVFGWYNQRAMIARVKKLDWNLISYFMPSDAYVKTDADGQTVIDPTNTEWLLDICRRYNVRLIPMLDTAAAKDHSLWLPLLEQVAAYYDGRQEIFALEPQNEGIHWEALTVEDFRNALKDKYGQIGKLNETIGASFADFAEIEVPEADKAADTPFGSVERGLWYERSLLDMDRVEACYRDNYQTIRRVSSLPINDRSSPIPENNGAAPQRLERLARWHDHLGTHAQCLYDLERTRGYADGKTLWLTEFYWNYYGGPWGGLRYRLHGSFMLPESHIEAMNLAASERNLWMAIARGAEAFTLYGSYVATWAWDKTWAGPCTIFWPDLSLKRSVYAHKFMPHIYDTLGGEIQGSHTESPIALVEPIASRLHLDGSILEQTTVSIRSELESTMYVLAEMRVQPDLKPPSADLSPYRYVFLPSSLCLEKNVAGKLLDYAAAGGTVIATLAPGLYDEHSRPDGTFLKKLGVAAEALPIGEHGLTIDGEQTTLPHAVVYAYQVTDGVNVLAKYTDGRAAVVDAPVGNGRVVLVGWAASLAPQLMADRVFPAVIDRKAFCDWTLDAAPGTIDCLVRYNDDYRLFFITNKSHEKVHGAKLAFDAAHDVADLRARLRLKNRQAVEFPALLPGECRILKVYP